MKNYSYKLTEEIARWAFEVKCKNSNNWIIAFTNPTAGPWKSVKCPDDEGKLCELYRFDLKEVRPDIILINDDLEIIVIVEAKDKINNLLKESQVKKSIEVVNKLQSVFSQSDQLAFWSKRLKYPILTGLLWGASKPSSESIKSALFNTYHNEVSKYPNLDKRLILGLEVLKNSQTNEIICSAHYKQYEKKGLETISPVAIIQSLNL